MELIVVVHFMVISAQSPEDTDRAWRVRSVAHLVLQERS